MKPDSRSDSLEGGKGDSSQLLALDFPIRQERKPTPPDMGTRPSLSLEKSILAPFLQKRRSAERPNSAAIPLAPLP